MFFFVSGLVEVIFQAIQGEQKGVLLTTSAIGHSAVLVPSRRAAIR